MHDQPPIRSPARRTLSYLVIPATSQPISTLFTLCAVDPTSSCRALPRLLLDGYDRNVHEGRGTVPAALSLASWRPDEIWAFKRTRARPITTTWNDVDGRMLHPCGECTSRVGEKVTVNRPRTNR